jgi:putative ABC transport system permease protein
MLQSYAGTTTLIARSGGDPRKLITSIRAELQQFDSHLPIFRAEPLAEKLALPLLPARVAALLLIGFGSLALVLSAIGIYGVMSYAVSRRTQEIGVRMALGAEAVDVLKFTIADGLTPTLLGIGIGLSVAMALTQSIKSVLFGVSATDPLTYAAVTALLVTVAFVTCYIPARRATRIDPMVALRYN